MVKIIQKNINNLNTKGITLISLVITITIMIILAAVSINFLLGDNGIIAKAKGASTNFNDSKIEEELEMGISDTDTEFLEKAPTNNEFADKLNEKFGNRIEWVYKDSLAGKYKGKEFTIIDGKVIIGSAKSHIIRNDNCGIYLTDGGKAYCKYRFKTSNITISIENNLEKYTSGEVQNAVENTELSSDAPNKYLPWNVSYHPETNNIFAYLKKNETTSIPATDTTPEQTFYDLYIVSDSKIYMPTDSSNFFAGFSDIYSINGLNNIDTSNVTNMKLMFSNFGSKYLTSLDLGNNFNTSNVTDMQYMFTNCGTNKLETFNIGTKFNTSKCQNMSYMFSGFGENSLLNLDLGQNFDTSNVIDMNNMFNFCGYRVMASLNLGDKFNTSNVTNMQNMFHCCGLFSLKNFALGNKFNTSKVTNMKSMFDSFATNMPTLNLGNNFDTSKVTDMSYMFNWATNRISLILGDKFDTSKVTNMDCMFYSCGLYKMTSLNLGDKFDTSKVTNMDCMFYACGHHKMTNLNLGDNFDTSKVTSMNKMFCNLGYNSLLSLSLGNKFDTSKVTNMESIFERCGYYKMTSLNLGDKFKIRKDCNITNAFKNAGVNTCEISRKKLTEDELNTYIEITSSSFSPVRNNIKDL